MGKTLHSQGGRTVVYMVKKMFDISAHASGLINVTPASMLPLHRSTMRSIWISNISPSRSARFDMTIASLNSLSALGRLAVRPAFRIRAFRPCKW
jgi:hypothetical protein